MTDFPGERVLPLFISTLSRFSAIWDSRMLVNSSVAVASAPWPVANLGVYTPFWLPFAYPMRRAFFSSGSSAGNNWDIGVYTMAGLRLWSAGSTVATGANTPFYVAPTTPLLLPPGRYYLGVSHSTTTANRAAIVTAYAAQFLRQVGFLQEASALPLPAVMTPVAIASACMPLAGLTRTASGF